MKGRHEEPVTVMHVITGLNTGGAEMMLCRLVERAAETRHRVVSLMPGGPLAARLRRAEIPVDELTFRPSRISLGGAGNIVRLVWRHRPDVLQGWMYHANIAATLAYVSSFRRAPLLWGVHHSFDDTNREKPLTRRLIASGARLSRLPSSIVYCAEASARQHEAIGFDPDRTVIIPNGIDCNLFRPRVEAGERLRRELGIGADVAVIGMLAGYRPMKDHGNLLRAVSVLEHRSPIRLVLIGPGVHSDNAELVRQIAGAGLGQQVSLLGERHDVPELVAGFDVLVLPSAWGESFPLVLCEAMASGVPCIATDVGDSRWIIGDTGVVVPPREPDALAQALAEILGLTKQERRLLGQQARARIVGHWALTDIVSRYEALYREVNSRRGGRHQPAHDNLAKRKAGS